MAILKRYSWPGNVRELQNVLRHALLQSSGPVLFPEFLPEYLRKDEETERPTSPLEMPGWEEFLDSRLRAGSQNLFSEALALVERDVLTYVLNRSWGNQAQAARILGISRLSSRNKIRSLGITIKRPGKDVTDLGKPETIRSTCCDAPLARFTPASPRT